MLVLKLVIIPFSQTVDPDAVVRIFQSSDWKNAPHWIGNNVWGPFNYYLNGIGLFIYNNLILTPKLLNVIFSTLTLVPIYKMLIVGFEHKVSILTTIVFGLSPIIFRNSLMAMTETPYMFFVAIAMWKLQSYFETHRSGNLVWTGTAITIAAGFRYEAWALIFVFWIMFLVKKEYKKAMIFAGLAGLFPLIWLVSNYIYTGDFLWSLKGNNHWTLEVMKTNDSVSSEEWLRRGWFIPFMFFIGLGPVFLLFFLRGMSRMKIRLWWMPISFIFALLIYKSLNGTLLHHPRFADTLMLLGVPILAFGVKRLLDAKKWKLYYFMGIIIQLSGSYIYNVDHIEPIPLLKDQNSLSCLNSIERSGENKKTVFIDFIGWEETYFYALQLMYRGNEVYLVSDYDSYDQIEMTYGEFTKSINEKWVVSNVLLEENSDECLLLEDQYETQRVAELILLSHQ